MNKGDKFEIEIAEVLTDGGEKKKKAHTIVAVKTTRLTSFQTI